MSEQSQSYTSAPIGGLPPTEVYLVGDPSLDVDAWAYVERIEPDAEGGTPAYVQQQMQQGCATAPVRYVLADMLTNAVADANKWHERYSELNQDRAALEAGVAEAAGRAERAEAKAAGLLVELGEAEAEKLAIVLENQELRKLLQAGKEYMELTRRTQNTPFHDLGKPTFPNAAFDTQEQYDASVESVVARIESGEIQPRQPDTEEDASEPPLVAQGTGALRRQEGGGDRG
jgi:hypothetical protein